MTTYEVASVAISIVAVIVSTIVLVLLLKQVGLLSKQVADARQAIDFATKQADVESVRKRRQATMEYIAGTMNKLQDYYKEVPPAGSAEQASFLAAALIRGSDEFLALRNYLNYLEILCTGVNLDIFDTEVVYRSIGGRIQRAWTAYEPFVDKERDTLGAHAILYTELQACITRFTAFENERGLQ